MTGIGKSARKQDWSNRPFDEDFLRNPFNESKLADMIFGTATTEERPPGLKPSMTATTREMLNRMSTSLGIKKLINEQKDEHLEFELEEDDE